MACKTGQRRPTHQASSTGASRRDRANELSVRPGRGTRGPESRRAQQQEQQHRARDRAQGAASKGRTNAWAAAVHTRTGWLAGWLWAARARQCAPAAAVIQLGLGQATAGRPTNCRVLLNRAPEAVLWTLDQPHYCGCSGVVHLPIGVKLRDLAYGSPSWATGAPLPMFAQGQPQF